MNLDKEKKREREREREEENNLNERSALYVSTLSTSGEPHHTAKQSGNKSAGLFRALCENCSRVENFQSGNSALQIRKQPPRNNRS